MASNLPVNFAIPGENVIASYDWVDISSGLGYAVYYPCIAEDNVMTFPILTQQAFGTATTTGLISVNGTYAFISNNFVSPRTLKGEVILSGYLDYTSGAGIYINAKIKKMVGSTYTRGSVLVSNTTEVSDVSGGGDVLKKTLTVNNFFYDMTYQVKVISATNQAFIRLVITYEDNDAYDTGDVSIAYSTEDYRTLTLTNPYPDKLVTDVKIYLNDDAGTPYEKDTYIYAISGLTVTDITDTITSLAVTADQMILLKIPIDEHLAIGDRISLVITKGGGTGGVVCDPTNEVVANPTLKLNIPFKVEL